MFQYQGGNMMRSAAMKNQQQQSFFDGIGRAIALGQQNKDRELKKKQIEAQAQAKANDPKNLGTEYILGELQKRGMSREQASAELLNAKSGGMQIDPTTGNIIQRPSLFDQINLSQSPKTKQNAQQQEVTQAPTQNTQFTLDSFTPMSGLENNPKAQQVAIEEAAKQNVLEQKNIRKEEREKQQADIDTLPVLESMLGYNSKTLETPYAGIAQPVTRFTNPEAAENMALLKQRQLRLAAPLAKQLGVNPTDKDFQNTLDQIFNENESRSTREKQIKSLINDIHKRQGLKPKPAQVSKNKSINLKEMSKEQRYELYLKMKGQR